MDIPINNETYNGHGMGQYPGLRQEFTSVCYEYKFD